MKYRKKPVVIEAMQWLGGYDCYHKICSFVGESLQNNHLGHEGPQEIFIPTLEGEMTARVGDYIIKGVKGEYYPCKEDVFNMTYEKAED